MCEDNEKIEQEISWPKTKDLPYEILAHKVVEFCRELSRREKEKRGHPLVAAKRIWPQLREALSAAKREVGLNNLAEPVMPEWAEEPVVALSGGYYDETEHKTKSEILEIALSVGDGSWATIGDLWLWVGGGGPIVEKTLEKFGFYKK